MNKIKTVLVTGIAAITLSNAVLANQGISVYVDAIDTSETIIEQPKNQRMSKQWTLTDAEHQGIQSMYVKSIERQLARQDGYMIVSDKAGADIAIQAILVELEPNAPKDNTMGRDSFAQYITEGAGDMTVAFTLTDEDGTETFIKEQSAGNFWGVNDRFNNCYCPPGVQKQKSRTCC